MTLRRVWLVFSAAQCSATGVTNQRETDRQLNSLSLLVCAVIIYCNAIGNAGSMCESLSADAGRSARARPILARRCTRPLYLMYAMW